jgi:hypothetical protein
MRRSSQWGDAGRLYEGRSVILTGQALLLFAAVVMTESPSGAEPARFAQLVVRERIIVRVPARPVAITPARLKWKEKRGPRCVAMASVGGAAVVERKSVDLMLKGGQRVRAQFESSCPALDYYSGFYIMPSADGRICADRDSIHTRAGGECQVTRFRKLVVDK